MAGTWTASFYTCPRLLSHQVALTSTAAQGEDFPLGEVDTVKVFFGEHNRPCYGGENCDSKWREENTCQLEELLGPHRRYHVARGGNSAEEFDLNARLIKNHTIFEQGLRILLQKERDWMSIHPNADPYPHTTPNMYDTWEEQESMARNPHTRRSPGIQNKLGGNLECFTNIPTK